MLKTATPFSGALVQEKCRIKLLHHLTNSSNHEQTRQTESVRDLASSTEVHMMRWDPDTGVED